LNENYQSYSVQVTLPPVCYDENNITIQSNGFIKNNFKIKYTDANFHLDLSFEEPFSILKRNAKKNLKKALNADNQLILADNQTDEERAYSIIQRNRTEKGYPLKMSFQDLLRTGKVVKIDFFILKMNLQDVAAAIVFRINPQVAMVVYWGHLYDFSELRPVNLMAFLLMNTYKKQGFKILDIGPSSENGILDEGLASFKESLGCIVSDKFTLIKTA
jgi:lipid II:glycine glycyltransferase (peptidoglycan interpeptide bridge formation enzyme)